MESEFDTVQTLKKFFSNIVSNLKISFPFRTANLFTENINEVVIKSIVKYRNHTSLPKIREVCNRRQQSLFFFSHVDKEQVLKEILTLDSANAI